MIFAFHGYPALIHRLTYRRTNHDNIHVRGYNGRGTTTTPFDMLMMNDLDRFRLVMDVILGYRDLTVRYATLSQNMDGQRAAHRAYTRDHGEDPEDVNGWLGLPFPAAGARPRGTADDNQQTP